MIARKSALIIATNIINGLLGYIALYFITRYMSPEAYGIMGFAYSFVALFTIFADLGFDNAHIKRASEGNRDLGTCIGTFLSVKLGLTGILAIVTVSAVFFWKIVVGRGFESPTHELAIYLMLGYWIFRVLARAIVRTFQARKKIAKVQLPLFLETLVRVSAIVFVALSGYGAIELVLTYVAGGVVFFIASLLMLRGYPINKPSKEYFKDYSKFAFPVIIAMGCSLIITNSDKVIIQLFWNAEDVGFYFSAFRLAEFISMFSLAIHTLLFPTISSLHSKKDFIKIKLLTLNSERYLSMIVFPLVFGLIVLAEPVVKILLSGWEPAYPILQILPLMMLFASLEIPYQSHFLGTDQPKIVRNRVFLMVLFNIGLNFILIPRDINALGITLFGWGARGAAIATVISYLIGLLYSRYMAYKLHNIKGSPVIILHAVAASVMALCLYTALYSVQLLPFIDRWYILLAVSFLGLGIYIFVLYLLYEFTKKDLKFFLETLNIKKMLQYIMEELRGK